MKIDRRYENFLLLLICFFAVVIWALPIWFTPGKIGIGDWDTEMRGFEALRRTVVEFKQWPEHNPWLTGGVPLLGDPGLTLLSIRGLMILIFGTYWGLRSAVLIYLFIGFMGAWKLSGIWWSDRFIRLAFAFYIAANPALIYHISGGHLLFQTFYFMPLLFFFLFRFNQDKWSGLKAAIAFGVAFNDSPSYMVQYGVLIFVCIYLYLFVTNRKGNLRILLRWLGLFLPVVLALTFYRVVTIQQVAHDFPRVSNFRTHYEWASLLKYYLFPYTEFARVASCEWCHTTSEVCSYVGIVAFILVLVSLRQGFRWWHGVIALFVWAGIGNYSYFHIMYWIQKIPTFSSHLCFTRIRTFTLLFFAIAATSGLNYIWMKCKNPRFRALRYVGLGIGILMVGEVMLVSHMIMKSSHVNISFSVGDSHVNKFHNISSLPRPKGVPEIVNITYYATRMNLGWLRGYGASYLPGNTSRIGRDEPGYMGEFHQNGQAIEPVYWSPNRILLQGLDPSLPLIVNMNPGSPWHNNGNQLFAQYRIVEMCKPFEVMPDENGVVVLTYRYPGQKLGIYGTIFWAVVSVVIVVVLYKNRLKQSILTNAHC